jgi:glycerol-3-phosphate dehydrogenase
VDPDIRLKPSRGTHLVLPAELLGNPTAALTVPIPGETNRFVFALPAQLGRVYLGLTDEAVDGPLPDVPAASDGEIDFLLDTVNTALATPITRADVVGTYAGLRPLLDSGEGKTADLSRNHAVLRSSNDAAVAAGGLTARSCVTTDLPAVGATRTAPRNLPPSLVARYGSEAGLVAEAGALTPIAEGIDVTHAELAFAVSHEGALDVDDLLDRRTRIGLVAADRERAMSAAEDALTRD